MEKAVGKPRAAPPTSPQPRLPAAPGVFWREDFCCFGFGAVKSVCIGAWVFFLVIPGLFFWLVTPGLQERLGLPLTLAALGMYGVATLCFVCASCWDPGVPNRPPAMSPDPRDESVEHPGESYTLSRDSNRYVRAFDHFCEFVGNDIGGRNMPCFVGFLVSLALFSTLLLGSCVIATAVMWLGWQPEGATGPGPATLRFASEPWPYAVGGAVLLLLLLGLRSCWSSSDLCSGTLPLVMMMPGASVGVGLLLCLLLIVAVLPLVTDMWSEASWDRNPAPLYLMLPILAFAVRAAPRAAPPTPIPSPPTHTSGGSPLPSPRRRRDERAPPSAAPATTPSAAAPSAPCARPCPRPPRLPPIPSAPPPSLPWPRCSSAACRPTGSSCSARASRRSCGSRPRASATSAGATSQPPSSCREGGRA